FVPPSSCALLILYIMSTLCFFFSSRRRHTRSKRDWSSDVCSSDLSLHPFAGDADEGVQGGDTLGDVAHVGRGGDRAERPPQGTRSEERRVGKECRSRRASEPERKKRKEVQIRTASRDAHGSLRESW